MGLADRTCGTGCSWRIGGRRSPDRSSRRAFASGRRWTGGLRWQFLVWPPAFARHCSSSRCHRPAWGRRTFCKCRSSRTGGRCSPSKSSLLGASPGFRHLRLQPAVPLQVVLRRSGGTKRFCRIGDPHRMGNANHPGEHRSLGQDHRNHHRGHHRSRHRGHHHQSHHRSHRPPRQERHRSHHRSYHPPWQEHQRQRFRSRTRRLRARSCQIRRLQGRLRQASEPRSDGTGYSARRPGPGTEGTASPPASSEPFCELARPLPVRASAMAPAAPQPPDLRLAGRAWGRATGWV
mmetsp:Transcript_23978/g.52308  ORF Transcript_23978/g.52308 Transcript_23978/m.52308 type:complete len:291 (-) Transcript_23978:13-885(-)